jgi:hybrid cluster-associated redox disulfide protein
MKQKKKISISMTFAELIRYPEAVEVLMKKGFHCIGCPASSFETIEQGAVMHGLNPQKLVEEINLRLDKKKNKPKPKLNKKSKKKK